MKKKILAGLLSTALLCSSIPAAWTPASAETEGKLIYSADFEEDNGGFSSRDDDSTTAVSDNTPHGGGKCLECSGRTQSWNGPQLPVEGIMEKNTEYIVSAWVRTQWYGEVCLSLQYTDANGEDHYSNLSKATCQGDWILLEAPVSLGKNMSNVFVYFECVQTDVSIFVDDFKITAPPEPELEDIPSLKNVYSKYFKFGTATTVSELAPKAAQELIKKHFNSLTAGNELKPDALLNKKACQAMAEEGDDTDPQISLASASDILDFARDNHISVRGHVLVWHSQTPDWFFKENYDDKGDWVSKEKMLKRMENYIKNVFTAVKTEYPDVDFYAWDVVNEAWSDNGEPRQPGEQGSNGSEKSAWVQVFGDNSFIEPAFEFARKYAPEGCKLYYNDYNEYMTGKTNAMIKMATELKAKNLIDGIGMQSHLDVRPGNDPFPSLAMYKNAMKAFSETGLDVQVTELDATIDMNTKPEDLENAFKIQADYYKGVLDICREYSDSVSAVVLWGTTDDKSWRNERYPLIFNGDFTAKPAYYSIIDGLEVPVTEPTTAPPATTTTTTAPPETTTTTSETETTVTTESSAPETTTTTVSTSDDVTTNPVPTTNANPTDPTTQPTTTVPPTEPVTTTTTEEVTEPATTLPNGAYPVPSDAAASIYGDVNCDGAVNIADVVKLNKFLLNNEDFALQPTELANSDCVRDSVISAADSTLLMSFVAMTIEQDKLGLSYEETLSLPYTDDTESIIRNTDSSGGVRFAVPSKDIDFDTHSDENCYKV